MVSDQSAIIPSATSDDTIQWMSPELLHPNMFGLGERRLTRQSDCYALGMVMYEVISGQPPFPQYLFHVAAWKVLEGERPRRPREEGTLFTDGIWGILELCWKAQPGDRISAKAVLMGLEGNPPPSRPPYYVYEDVETDSDGQSDTTASVSSTSPPPGRRSWANLQSFL